MICDWERILIGGVFITFHDNFNKQILNSFLEQILLFFVFIDYLKVWSVSLSYVMKYASTNSKPLIFVLLL